MRNLYFTLLIFSLFWANLFSQDIVSDSLQIDFVEASEFLNPVCTKRANELLMGEFFPMNPDLTFRYQSNIGKAEGKIIQDGEDFIISFKGSKFRYKQTCFRKDDGIYQTESINRVLRFFGRDHEYPEPIPILPLPIRIGAEWEWTGIQIAKNDTTQIRVCGKIYGKELIETPAGIFDCLKTELTFFSEKGSSYQFTQWLTENVGMVRSEIRMNGKGLGALLQKIMGLSVVHFELLEVRGLILSEAEQKKQRDLVFNAATAVEKGK